MQALEPTVQVKGEAPAFLTCSNPYISESPAVTTATATAPAPFPTTSLAAGLTRAGSIKGMLDAGWIGSTGGMSDFRSPPLSDDRAGGVCRYQEPVTVVSADGSEIVVGEDDRVRSLKDAVNRTFQFGYDLDTGELNRVTNEQGIWRRLVGLDGRYSDNWRNIVYGSEWTGTITVDRSGCCFEDDNDCILYLSNGTQIIDHLADGQPYARTKEDRLGNVAIEDLLHRKVNYFFIDGRSAVRDLTNHSLLGYDAHGNLAIMRDANGNRFEFLNYDSDKQPRTVVNTRGRWHKVSDGSWCNGETGQIWKGRVEVDPRGSYSFIDGKGTKTTRNVQGRASCQSTVSL